MAQNIGDLSKVLEAQWTDAGVDPLLRQYSGRVARIPVFRRIPVFSTPTTSSQTLRNRRARQQEIMQRLAIAQRKGKPSYRQRQKNGRAGRK